ncbi:MAG: type II toxin-antitoxin system HicB family antitoxin [Oscillospiraceae bacterium]|nr:type II toxin-antitoxin system HicB family antitoxin [Oscillospiraceae bacterium]
MIYSYPGCFFQRPDGRYCVVFADLNNLAAFGDDFDHALSNGIELLARYIYNLLLRKEPIPQPSDIQELKPSVSDEYNRAFLRTVNVDVEEYAKYHFERNVNKSVPVLKWLDDFAREENIDIPKMVNDMLLAEYNRKKSERA